MPTETFSRFPIRWNSTIRFRVSSSRCSTRLAYRTDEPATLFMPAVALTDGSVLLAGGQPHRCGPICPIVCPCFFQTARFFEGPVSAPDFIARKSHRARRLNDGSVLLAGGLDLNGRPLASTYRYFPADQSFRPQGDMATARSGHSLNDIERGGELAGCGWLQWEWYSADHRNFHDECESSRMFFGGLTPSATTGCWISLGTALELPTPVWGHSAATVNNGSEVVVVGGYTSSDRTQVSQEITVIPSSLSGTQSGGTLGVGGGDLAVAVTSNGQSPELVLAGGRRGDTPQQRFVRLVRSHERCGAVSAARACSRLCAAGIPEARYGAEAIALDNQTVIVIGGANGVVLTGFHRHVGLNFSFPPTYRLAYNAPRLLTSSPLSLGEAAPLAGAQGGRSSGASPSVAAHPIVHL